MSGLWKPSEGGNQNGEGRQKEGIEAEFIQPQFPWKVSWSMYIPSIVGFHISFFLFLFLLCRGVLNFCFTFHRWVDWGHVACIYSWLIILNYKLNVVQSYEFFYQVVHINMNFSNLYVRSDVTSWLASIRLFFVPQKWKRQNESCLLLELKLFYGKLSSSPSPLRLFYLQTFWLFAE